MLSLRPLPRCMGQYLKQSQLHTSVKLLSANDSSSSSSSDSSDSDSDKDNKAKKEQAKKTIKGEYADFASSEKTNERLNSLLLNISQASAKTKNFGETKVKQDKSSKAAPDKTKNVFTSKDASGIDVAIKPRSTRLAKPQSKMPEKEQPIEQQIVGAAKDVAQSLGGDTEKTELELLNQILNSGAQSSKKVETTTKQASKPTSLTELLTGMKVDPFERIKKDEQQTMLKKMKDRLVGKDSISKALLYQKQMKAQRSPAESGAELNAPCMILNIFQNMPKEKPQVPQLLTWEEMEKKEIKLTTLTTPQNVFQELIQWTEQGKLWHFPINNEQGLEQEKEVHFSEHVFMERHLKGWCPKKGPIRHFMELVCTGLSKNPYMTVEEKIGHITWYKNYFDERKDLLTEIGALGEKAPAPAKQIEA